MIDAGFVVLFYGGEGALHGSAVRGVSANFELGGELVQESGAAMVRYGLHAFSSPLRVGMRRASDSPNK